MRLPDSWSFRQRPEGWFERFLHLPVYLYRWRLGWVLGDRFLLIEHVGRTSGRAFETPVEVVQHDTASGEYVVCSGTGPTANWYRNLKAAPARSVQVGRRRWAPGQRFLEPAEAAERFAAYEREHPATARRLLALMGNEYDGTDTGRVAMMERMPMVAFTERARAARSAAG